MNLELTIPVDWQFGQVAAETARSGALRQAVAQAIQRHLFDEALSSNSQPAKDDPSAESGTASRLFAQSVASFARSVAQLHTSQAESSELLRGVLATQRPAVPAQAGTTRADDPSRWEPVFCIVLHALCWSLAAARLDESDPALEGVSQDDELAPDDEGPEAARPDEDEVLSVEQAAAAMAVARAIVAAQPWRRKPPDKDAGPKPSAEHARLLGKALMLAMVEAMPEHFCFGEQRLELEDGQPLTRQYLLLASPGLAAQLLKLLAELPLRFTAQPLAHPVAYASNEGGLPEDEPGSTHINVPLIGYRRQNQFLRRFQKEVLQRGGFDSYLRAIDIQQAVPWRINRSLWSWVLRLREFSRQQDPEQWLPDLRQAVNTAGLDTQAQDALREWLTEQVFLRKGERDADRRRHAQGEFLDSPLARRALEDLQFAADGGEPRRFFLPWKADYRGRIYAETPWLTPQGGDLQRALFEFADGRVLDAAGIGALRRHGANLARRSFMLASLGIERRQVLTLDERERWIIQHEREILASAEAPLKHDFWRLAASKPMQFLAFCMAYRQWKLTPDRPVHLPVQIDGTCNGLQHIAALTGDKELARAVNVLPSADGVPGDIYSQLAAAALQHLGQLVAAGGEPDGLSSSAHRQAQQAVDAMLARRSAWQAWLDRNAAKAVVMTVPYGASELAQAGVLMDTVAPAIEALASDPSAFGDAEWDLARSLAALAERDRGVRTFIRKASSGHFRASWRSVRKGDAAAEARVRALRALASYLSLVLVRHVRAALTQAYPSVDAFAAWLETVARRCAGLPLMWRTPLGLPVCQDGFEESRTTLNARMGGGKTVSVGIARLQELVSDSDQRRALLPNLVHSLDATHLAMTLNRAVGRGITDIGTIHDCLLCHPNDADALGAVVRETFASLYRARPEGDGHATQGPLAAWSEWMNLVANIACLRDAHLVIGALERPEGAGEQMMRAAAAMQGKAASTESARASLKLVERIRQLDPASRAMVDMLLDYARRVPVRLTRKEREERALAGFSEPATSRTRHDLSKAWPRSPVQGDLSLGTAVPSTYFFS